MTEQQQRRARIRQARRRPTPATFRAGIPRRADMQTSAQPASTPDPSPNSSAEPAPGIAGLWQRLRKAKWAHIITIAGTGLAALAAIGGLWAQAVTSYWSQQTAKDQLGQSKKDSERDMRDQASKVTFWLEYPSSGAGPELHVLNRSLDPVTDAYMEIRRFKVGLYAMVLRDLGPCTEFVFDSPKMELLPIDGKGVVSFAENCAEFRNLAFVDSNGKAWERSATSLKYPLQSIRDADLRGFVLSPEPRIKKTTQCG